MQDIEKRISNRQILLNSVNVLLEEPTDFKVSNLCKTIICFYNKDYQKALTYLNECTEKQNNDVYVHANNNGKAATEYAFEYCMEKLV
ncbi:hypothetical protein [Clostridium omnivorum]|uniref:Uncharacterized protein n=1 Tax=Clostridium omnivorum TaxID=1604902 RepID=A0ABQ5N9L9_9CLOT|nr:hypothetical protein [Clostridium sp. E14]GLC31735.1 hypothetical protein bsdE14_31450 [Clostridium sp. E14]